MVTTARFTLERADPSWFPKVLNVLARDYPEINDTVWSTAIGENAEAQVIARGRTAEFSAAFAKSIAAKARWVNSHPGDRWPAWSTGEVLAVALVLDTPSLIEAECFTVEQALSRLAGDIAGSAADAERWVEEVRAAL